jgi:hypothetical protein
VTRSDLSFPQQAVQSAHAAIEAAKAFPEHLEPHPHLIICCVKNEAQLQDAMARIAAQGIRLRAFYEPDIGGELTAFASEPIQGEQRKAFKRYQLMKSPSRVDLANTVSI